MIKPKYTYDELKKNKEKLIRDKEELIRDKEIMHQND